MSSLYSLSEWQSGHNLAILQRLWNSSLLVCPLDKYRFEHCRATQRPPVFFTEHEKGTFRNFGMMRQLLLKLLKGNKRRKYKQTRELGKDCTSILLYILNIVQFEKALPNIAKSQLRNPYFACFLLVGT
uniref:Uncharacterized protein n=1 Tax=Cacopsylla melanoneura TaxID=428564 RepID=A0A8D9EVZ4_9HEMI